MQWLLEQLTISVLLFCVIAFPSFSIVFFSLFACLTFVYDFDEKWLKESIFLSFSRKVTGQILEEEY